MKKNKMSNSNSLNKINSEGNGLMTQIGMFATIFLLYLSYAISFSQAFNNSEVEWPMFIGMTLLSLSMFLIPSDLPYGTWIKIAIALVSLLSLYFCSKQDVANNRPGIYLSILSSLLILIASGLSAYMGWRNGKSQMNVVSTLIISLAGFILVIYSTVTALADN